MRNNETGEFELIVGNRQLLSGFFIVVLLFAVAFAMGYVVGQNSPRSAKLAAEAASTQSGSAADAQRPAPVSNVASQQSAAPAAPADGGTAAPPDSSASAGTQPAKEADAAPSEPAAAAPAAQDAAAPQLPAGSEAPAAPTGSYWQVTALAPADALIFYETLKGKGFPTYLSPAPKGLVRVLVGPYTTKEALGKAKTDLENAGFAHPFRR